MLDLADRPREAVAFLKDKMKPLKISSEQMHSLLLKLNSTDEHIWKPVFEELRDSDPRLAIPLPDLMDRVTESPARQRLVEILSEREVGSLEGKKITLIGPGPGDLNIVIPGDRSWWVADEVALINRSPWGNLNKKWTRAERAIVLLKHIRTPEALAILADMATGHPDAAPTKVARELLKRPAANTKQIDGWWTDLEKAEAEASCALLELDDRTKETVTFLKDRMKPLTISPVQMRSLLLKLNSANERVWRPAVEELEYFDPRLAIGLQDLMEHVTEPRVQTNGGNTMRS